VFGATQLLTPSGMGVGNCGGQGLTPPFRTLEPGIDVSFGSAHPRPLGRTMAYRWLSRVMDLQAGIAGERTCTLDGYRCSRSR
jgi:hypothetical protein